MKSKKEVEIHESDKQTKMSTKIIYMIVGYLFPLIISLVLFASKSLGVSGINCWVKEEKYKYGLVVYIIRVIMLIVIVIISGLLLSFLKNDEGKFSDKFYYVVKNLSYPIIQAINIFLPFVFYIWNLSDGHDKSPPKWLGDATLMVGGVVGLIYPLTYLLVDIIFSGIETILDENKEESLAELDTKPTVVLGDGN